MKELIVAVRYRILSFSKGISPSEKKKKKTKEEEEEESQLGLMNYINLLFFFLNSQESNALCFRFDCT